MNVRLLPPFPGPEDEDPSGEAAAEGQPPVMRALPIEVGGPGRCTGCGRFAASNEERCERCAAEVEASEPRPTEVASRTASGSSGATGDHAFAKEVAWVFDRTRTEFVMPRPSELHRLEHAPVIREAAHLPAPPPSIADRPRRAQELPSAGAVRVEPVVADDRAADVGPADAWLYHARREPATHVGIVPTAHEDEPSIWSQALSAAAEPRWLARIVIVIAVLLSTLIPLLLLR